MHGRHVTGVEAAAAAYFGKAASELSIEEAAMLAAIVRSPNYFSPLSHPARALERRNHALRMMLDLRGGLPPGHGRAAAGLGSPLTRRSRPSKAC